MKKLLTTIAVAACAITTYAQGTVEFITSTLTPAPRILMPDGTPVGSTAAGAPAGTLFLAQLYAGAGNVTDSASLVPVGNPVNIRGGGNSGFVQESGTTTLGVPVNFVVSLPMVSAGAPATVQLRAWWAGPGGNTHTSYYEYAGPSVGLFGASPLLTLASTGGGGTPPAAPVPLTGLQGFRLIPVPEPTTWALLGLGAAALLIFRRRN